jgi:hypothetical protein
MTLLASPGYQDPSGRRVAMMALQLLLLQRRVVLAIGEFKTCSFPSSLSRLPLSLSITFLDLQGRQDVSRDPSYASHVSYKAYKA